MKADAGVADDHVEPAKRLDSTRDERADVGVVRHVPWNRDRLAAPPGDGGHHFVQPIGAPGRNRDRRAFFRAVLRGRTADARRRARDRHHTAGQTHEGGS